MAAFRLPTRIYCAAGSLAEIGGIVAQHDLDRILLVIDAGLAATRWPSMVKKALDRVGCDVVVYDEVEPNPRYTSVDRMAEMARENGLEAVVGLGGGSVLDAGKAAAMLINNPGSCLEYEGKNRFKFGSAPFFAIPTTCGTGSEVTWVSVISHPGQQRKLSIKGEAMFPNAAVVDPDVLVTMPPHLVACTGIDAYTHALEAYTCNCGNPISDALAEKAIFLLDRFLLRAFRDIHDAEARFEVMRAATLAGMAFGNADVGAVHCLSESIGGIWDVPHGLANAVLLAPVMKAHGAAVQPRLRRLYMVLENDGTDSDEHLALAVLNRIERLKQDLEIPSFDVFGIAETAYAQIAEAAVANNSNASNPRPMGVSEYLEMLEGLGS